MDEKDLEEAAKQNAKDFEEASLAELKQFEFADRFTSIFLQQFFQKLLMCFFKQKPIKTITNIQLTDVLIVTFIC